MHLAVRGQSLSFSFIITHRSRPTRNTLLWCCGCPYLHKNAVSLPFTRYPYPPLSFNNQRYHSTKPDQEAIEDEKLLEIQQLQQDIHSLYGMGEYIDALHKAERLIQLTDLHYGSRHPSYASALNNGALLQKHLGNHHKAASLYDEALQCYLQCYGNEHPSYLICANNLAITYRTLGETEKARILFVQTLNTRTATLGESDANVAVSLHNLASLLRDMGDINTAITYQQRALTILRQRYGTEDIQTATAINNLAYSYKILGDYRTALPLYQQALGIRTRNLPNKHPDIIIAMKNMAECLDAMGDTEKAEQILTQILDSMETTSNNTRNDSDVPIQQESHSGHTAQQPSLASSALAASITVNR